MSRPSKGDISGTAARTALAVALVAGVTAVDFLIVQINSATAALTYLLLILALATWWGLTESLAASLAGMLCYNFFFLPPIGTFTIAEPQNWVTFLAFLITAITTSNLSSSARKRANEALERQGELERLYDLSRALILLNGDQPFAGQIAGRILQTLALEEVALLEQENMRISRAGGGGPLISVEALQHAARTGLTRPAGEGEGQVAPVNLGGRVIGSVGMRGAPLSETAMQAIASLIAIVLERERSREAAALAEAARRSEQLKSTLLDALAHEFKTPLTSIKAAASSALLFHVHGEEERDLLSIIDEETDRLTEMVTESIEVARIEAGRVRINCESLSVDALIEQTLERLRTFLDGRQLDVHTSPALPAVYVDAHLVSLVLRQLIYNAVKYSVPDSPIAISAYGMVDGVAISVANEGVGIPEQEHKAIFDKFYRGRMTQQEIPGSGLGLTIAREVIRAHGGRMWVESQPDQGARFSFTLPIHNERTGS